MTRLSAFRQARLPFPLPAFGAMSEAMGKGRNCCGHFKYPEQRFFRIRQDFFFFCRFFLFLVKPIKKLHRITNPAQQLYDILNIG